MHRAVLAAPLALRAGRLRREVRPGVAFRIGRHPSNDLVLEAKSVSRFHAQVDWTPDGPVLRDLVSTNGSFVDGVRALSPAPLESGAVLKIGDVVVHVEPGDAQAPAIVEAEEDADLTLFADRQAEREGVFARNVTLHRLLLDLEWEEQTGTLELTLAMAEARVTFALGRVVTARCGDRMGVDALERILAASVGAFRFQARYAPSEGSLDLSVREHLRRGYWDATRRLAR
jgi:hypothetical protein